MDEDRPETLAEYLARNPYRGPPGPPRPTFEPCGICRVVSSVVARMPKTGRPICTICQHFLESF